MTQITPDPTGSAYALRFVGDATAEPGAAGFPAIYAFGDSLSDAGNDFNLTLGNVPVSPPYFDGHFSNGYTWVEDLALLGQPLVKPSTQGGTDFAYGAAETGTTAVHSALPIDLPSQLVQYKIQDSNPTPNALYTLSIGANDVLDAVDTYATNPTAGLAAIPQAVTNETNFIAGLAATGAKNFAVLMVPDLGKTPSETAQGPLFATSASNLSAWYDVDLAQSLASLAVTDHLNIDLVNTFQLLDAAAANPAAFGLTNTTDPVWTGNYTDASSGTLTATGAAQNQHLFFDSLHPTAQGHAFVALVAGQSLLATV
jgi:phospholipase/lecithinase/hemolysin